VPRNNQDFKEGKEPALKDVITAHTRDQKITWEEAADLSSGWSDRAVASHGRSSRLAHRDKDVPAIQPTSDNRVSKIHKNAGLK